MALGRRSSFEVAPRLNATRARQGSRGTPVLWVLLISFTLAAIALAAAWAYRAGDLAATEPNNAKQVQDATAFSDTPQTPEQVSPGDSTAPKAPGSQAPAP